VLLQLLLQLVHPYHYYHSWALFSPSSQDDSPPSDKEVNHKNAGEQWICEQHRE
jgi:hypothetical protein